MPVLPITDQVRFLAALLFVLTFVTSACYYDVEEELYPDGGCNTTDVSYSNQVAPIIASNCLSCHSSALKLGGVALETHQEISVYVNNGLLLGAIRRDPGFAPMPQNQPKLPDCIIQQIEAWADEGALNN